MEITQISHDFSTCGQLETDDLAEVKTLGFRSLIYVRPDGEQKGQPTFGQIQECAKAQGLQARYVPVKPSGATEANHIAFSRALAELSEPVLGYCRSGQRAATLWHARRDTAA